MSDRQAAVRRAALGGALVATLASDSVAQATTDRSPLHRAKASLDASLRVVDDSLAQLNARLGEFEAATRSIVSDTVRAGPYVMVTSPALTAVVRSTLPGAAQEAQRRWGADYLAKRFANRSLRLRALGTPATPESFAIAELLIDGRPGFERRLNTEADSLAGELRAYLAWATADIDQSSGRRDLYTWLGGQSLSDPVADYRAGLVDVATAPALVARQCAAGDLARCVAALALGDTTRAKDEWYTDEDRRIVGRAWFTSYHRGTPEVAPPPNPCAAPPLSLRCRAWSDSLLPESWLQPVKTSTRMSFLMVAIELGGAEAWARLVDGRHHSMAQRLTAAAGRPLPDVAAVWRDRILAARPEPVRPRMSVLLVATLFGLASVGVAILRQERA